MVVGPANKVDNVELGDSSPGDELERAIAARTANKGQTTKFNKFKMRENQISAGALLTTYSASHSYCQEAHPVLSARQDLTLMIT